MAIDPCKFFWGGLYGMWVDESGELHLKSDQPGCDACGKIFQEVQPKQQIQPSRVLSEKVVAKGVSKRVKDEKIRSAALKAAVFKPRPRVKTLSPIESPIKVSPSWVPASEEDVKDAFIQFRLNGEKNLEYLKIVLVRSFFNLGAFPLECENGQPKDSKCYDNPLLKEILTCFASHADFQTIQFILTRNGTLLQRWLANEWLNKSAKLTDGTWLANSSIVSAITALKKQENEMQQAVQKDIMNALIFSINYRSVVYTDITLSLQKCIEMDFFDEATILVTRFPRTCHVKNDTGVKAVIAAILSDPQKTDSDRLKWFNFLYVLLKEFKSIYLDSLVVDDIIALSKRAKSIKLIDQIFTNSLSFSRPGIIRMASMRDAVAEIIENDIIEEEREDALVLLEKLKVASSESKCLPTPEFAMANNEEPPKKRLKADDTERNSRIGF